MNMDIIRTLRLKLLPTQEQRQILGDTLSAYTSSFNAVCQLGWDTQTFNGVELHKATYYAQRNLTQLPAQLVCSARVKATESLKSAKALLKKSDKVSCPQSRRCAIRYDSRSYSLWFDRQEITVVTLQGRVKLSFDLPDYYKSYASWKATSADLVLNRKGQIYLNVVMQTQINLLPETDEIKGVDLGVSNPAADSEGNLYGSDHWKAVEDRIFELKRRLQAKGTKSAQRHLKKLSGRQHRFRKDCDHVLSKRIVHSVEPGGTLALEDLTDLRKRVKQRKAQRRRLHGWSFAQLQAFVEYKATARSIRVLYVDPRYTSQKCSQCDHTARNNRPDQATFLCKQCGFSCHADINAAINIRNNAIKQRAAVNQPIVSVHQGSPSASGASSPHSR